MSRRYSIILAAGLAFCALIAFVVLPRPRAHAQAKPPIAFINVNVSPMDKEQSLENQTVIIRGRKIAEIGAVAKVKVLGTR